MRIDLTQQHAAPATDEARRSVSTWKRSWVDHERHAPPTTGKRNRSRVRETRLQPACHQFGSTFSGSCQSNSGRGRFAAVSLRNFAVLRIFSRNFASERPMKLEKEILFCPRAVNL